MTDCQGYAFGDVPLASLCSSKTHRRRGIEHQPRRERSLRHVYAHMGFVGAGGDIPIDTADIVARLVGTNRR
jgi:hypothetical protein